MEEKNNSRNNYPKGEAQCRSKEVYAHEDVPVRQATAMESELESYRNGLEDYRMLLNRMSGVAVKLGIQFEVDEIKGEEQTNLLANFSDKNSSLRYCNEIMGNYIRALEDHI